MAYDWMNVRADAAWLPAGSTRPRGHLLRMSSTWWLAMGATARQLTRSSAWDSRGARVAARYRGLALGWPIPACVALNTPAMSADLWTVDLDGQIPPLDG